MDSIDGIDRADSHPGLGYLCEEEWRAVLERAFRPRLAESAQPRPRCAEALRWWAFGWLRSTHKALWRAVAAKQRGEMLADCLHQDYLARRERYKAARALVSDALTTEGRAA